LKNGKAAFDGTVIGKLSAPQIAGEASATHFLLLGMISIAFREK